MSLPAFAPGVRSRASARVNRPVVISAVVVVALAFALTGPTRGLAALLGAGVAVGNWFALRFLAARFVGASAASSTGFSLLLIGKIGLLMAIVYGLHARLGADPIGLALGLSVLFVGPLLAGVMAGSAASAAASDPTGFAGSAEPRAAREPDLGSKRAPARANEISARASASAPNEER